MKKGILILTIFFVALAAWIVAFPNKNPFKKLLSKSPKPGQADPIEKNPSWLKTPGKSTSVFSPPANQVQDSSGFPLMKGSRGEKVRQLQAALNLNYGTDLAVDGIFGVKTYRAVSTFGFNADALSWLEWSKIISGV